MNLWSLYLSVLSFQLFFSGLGNPVLSTSLNPDFRNLPIHIIHISTPDAEQKHGGKKSRKSKCNQIIKQGIKGNVVLQKGNFMPGFEGKPKVGNGVKREIGFFELTKENQTEAGKGAGFFKKIKTCKILRVYSDKDGCFIARLKPGKYSMFVKEENEWYANSYGPNDEIFEVVVKEGEVISVEFVINHSASY